MNAFNHPLAESLRQITTHIEILGRCRTAYEQGGDRLNASWLEVALSSLRTTARILEDVIEDTSGEGQANG